METFVKIWSAQISPAAQKIWVAQNLRGWGERGVAAPQLQRHVRLWVLSPVFSIKLIIVSVQVLISETGLQFVPLLKKIKILNTKI